MSPPIHHKCCLLVIIKDLKKFHPFHTVTVTTNPPQLSPFLFLYYHPSSLQESNVVTHCHPFSFLALPFFNFSTPKFVQKCQPFYTVTVTTNSPQVLPKGYHQKTFKNCHPFYTVTVTTNSPQVLPKGYHQRP